MYHSLFDPSTLNDSQLLDKLGELRTKLIHAEQYGHMQMVEQILLMTNLVELEQEARASARLLEEFNKKNKITNVFDVGETEDIPEGDE